jgi:nitroreductase
MDFADLLKERRSVRAFEKWPVEPEKLQAILDAANAAPSAGNLQAYEIYQVTAPRTRAALAHASKQGFMAEAPVSLVFFANPGRSSRTYGLRGKQLYCLQDATIAAAYAQLAATNLGLATVWIGAFDDGAVCNAVGSPADWIPVAILPVGYPAEEPQPAIRRTLADLVHHL